MAEGFTGVPVFQVRAAAAFGSSEREPCHCKLPVPADSQTPCVCQISGAHHCACCGVQADGLTVATGSARYTPLFLSKSDLDIALANAEAQRCALSSPALPSPAQQPALRDAQSASACCCGCAAA